MVGVLTEVQPRKAGFMSMRRPYLTTATTVLCLILFAACSETKEAPVTTTPAPAPSPVATPPPPPLPTTPVAAPTAPPVPEAAAPAPKAAEPAPAPKAADLAESVTVYVTTKGKFYHRDGCKFLWRSKNPLTLKEAVAKGYKPCKVCKPPTPENPTAPAPESMSAPKKDTSAAAKKKPTADKSTAEKTKAQ